MSSSKVNAAKPEYNILLLGETGCGKSTTINAFANYLKYATFTEAAQNNFIQLIPTRFTLPNPDTGEPFVIESKLVDDNEREGNDGNSKTQGPMGYTFPLENQSVRIIDTPGMGDTRGMDVDKQNFDKILYYLNHHQLMHGIVILIKANETRKTASFRYCLTQLLAHLHKSACKNIVFCFTFSRNSFYGPGEGFATLSSFLVDELNEVNIKLELGRNCFFLDNEAYRFLIALKQGYPFGEYQRSSFKESWDQSAEQVKALLAHIQNIEPHNLRQTSSLNYARKLILELAEPMIRLQKIIYGNIEKIREQEAMIRRSDVTKSDILGKLTVQVNELQMKVLPSPTTTCTAQRCIEAIDLNGQTTINYKMKCHVGCRLSAVQSNIVGHSVLQGCSIMKANFCTNCGCSWQKHMHIRCEYIRTSRAILDSNRQTEFQSVEQTIAQVSGAVDEMKRLVGEYENELKVIQEVAVKFSYLLMIHSNVSSSRYIEPYINSLIEEERTMSLLVANYSSNNTKLLNNILDTHQRQLRSLVKQISNGFADNVTLDNIELLREQLFALKHCGKQFKNIMEKNSLSQENGLRNCERMGLTNL